MRKAQTIIEVLTTYSWTILIILVFLAILYYYRLFEPSRLVPETCSFGPGISCTTFKFQQKDPTSSAKRLLLVFSNGLGHDIVFENNSAIATAEGVGRIGAWNYSGICNPVRFVVKGGDQFVCIFDIDDTDVVLSLGKNVKFKLQVTYIDCATDFCYIKTGGCARGSRRMIYGEVTVKYAPYTYLEYCGNGFCNATAGETNASCSIDCQTPKLVPLINVTSPVNYLGACNIGYYHKLNVSLNFTIGPSDSNTAYSLDDGRCVGIQGNTSIPGPLSKGMHNVTVHADWNSSSIVVFKYCLGDLNHNGLVDMSDGALLSNRYGCNCSCTCGPCTCGTGSGYCWDTASIADLNEDCVVNKTDLDLLFSLIGTNCLPC